MNWNKNWMLMNTLLLLEKCKSQIAKCSPQIQVTMVSFLILTLLKFQKTFKISGILQVN